jgi:hypothetical protein
MEKFQNEKNTNPLASFSEHHRQLWAEVLLISPNASWEDIKARVIAEQTEAETADNMELSDSLASDMRQIERGFAPSTAEPEEEEI